VSAARPIRVLHVIHRVGDGGADHVLIRLANHSDPDRFQHTILALERGPGYEPPRAGVRSLELPPDCSNVLGAMRVLGDDLARFDVVHGWVAHASIVAAALAAAAGAPLVVRQPTNMEHELRWESRDAERYWRELRLAYGAAEAVIVPSPALVESTRRICGVDAPIVIPNAIDVDRFVPWRRRDRRGPFTLAFVGRLCHQKDPLTLVEALALLEDLVDWRLQVYGEGSLGSAMRDRLAALGLADRVTFAGFDRGWIEPSAGIDAFVLPTRYEGMSNALLEAAAIGMPIVTTAIPENLAFLEPDVHAFMAPPDCAPALAEAIRHAAAEPDRAAACGARARERMRSFSLSAMADAHEALYARLAGVSAAAEAA
jgi:glycosyltransferase involved in cell wall biosynthesis